MSAFKEVASFKTFITPSLIRFGFWLGVVMSLLTFVGAVIFGLVTAVVSGEPLAGLGMIVGGLFYLVFFLLYWRVGCEMVLVIFGIYERLDETADIMKASANTHRPMR
jgi:hypothetical protein